MQSRSLWLGARPVANSTCRLYGYYPPWATPLMCGNGTDGLEPALGAWDCAMRSMMDGIILRSCVMKLQERTVTLTRLALRPRHRKSAPKACPRMKVARWERQGLF